MKEIFSLILWILFTKCAQGQTWFKTCNYQYTIPTTSVTYLTSNNFPNRYKPGDSCKWYLTAPAGYTIELKCDYDLDTPLPNCQSQRLYVSRDGDKNLDYAEYYCDYSSITRVSVGNEISVGYTSNPDGNGWVRCEARAISTNQTNCQCGWSKTSRIVGGTYSQPNEYVSMGALIDSTMKNTAEGPVFCGVSIIHENFVLTAAHCFDVYRDVSTIGVLVGDNDISRADDTPYAALYAVQRVIKHANYVPTSEAKNYDIALVQTWEQIRWKKTIGPACLPYSFRGTGATFENYFNGYDLTVLGWGTTEFSGPSSNILKKTAVTVIANTQCSQTYGSINSAKICTYKKGTDSCQKDSGGSLYWTYSGRQYTIGIVSYGTFCAGAYPSVNTRVTSYITWIEDQLAGAFICKK